MNKRSRFAFKKLIAIANRTNNLNRISIIISLLSKRKLKDRKIELKFIKIKKIKKIFTKTGKILQKTNITFSQSCYTFIKIFNCFFVIVIKILIFLKAKVKKYSFT
jgi:hypothetical protein